MEDPNSTLLPYILEALSRNPELCDTFDNLCLDIEEQLAKERNNKYTNVRKSIQRALNVGQSLGIISLTNETIRVPFNFRATGRTAKGAAATASSANMDECEAPDDAPIQPNFGTGNPQPIQEKNAGPNAGPKRIVQSAHHVQHDNTNSNNNTNNSNNQKKGSSGHLSNSSPLARNAKVSKTHHHHHHCTNSGSHHGSNNNNNRSLRHDDSDYTILPQRHIPQHRKRGRPRRVTANRCYRPRSRSTAARRKTKRASSYGRSRSCRGRASSYGRRTTYRR